RNNPRGRRDFKCFVPDGLIGTALGAGEFTVTGNNEKGAASCGALVDEGKARASGPAKTISERIGGQASPTRPAPGRTTRERNRRQGRRWSRRAATKHAKRRRSRRCRGRGRCPNHQHLSSASKVAARQAVTHRTAAKLVPHRWPDHSHSKHRQKKRRPVP